MSDEFSQRRRFLAGIAVVGVQAAMPSWVRRLGLQSQSTPPAPPSTQVAVWPAGAVAGGTYQIQRPESVMNDRNVAIRLPANFTLTLAPDVDRIDWTVGRIEFGVGCTLDLSAAVPIHARLVPAEPPVRTSPHRDYFQPGLQGFDGGVGTDGVPGIPMKLDALAAGTRGCLWIRTDGDAGGPGGKGGKGQTSGGTKCAGTGQLKGASGGKGGTGGTGGKGGATSDVTITLHSLPVGYELRPAACASACGRSTRPSNANSDDGRIVIWGAPGCGGAGGAGGTAGEGDRSVNPRNCTSGFIFFTNYSVAGGDDGPPGDDGQVGAMGDCGVAIIKGP